MEWQYPKLSTLRIANNLDEDGYLITDGGTQTAASQKTLNLKGFKVPADGEDAEETTSSLQTVCNTIFKVFGLGSGLVPSGATSQVTAAVVEGD